MLIAFCNFDLKSCFERPVLGLISVSLSDLAYVWNSGHWVCDVFRQLLLEPFYLYLLIFSMGAAIKRSISLMRRW